MQGKSGELQRSCTVNAESKLTQPKAGIDLPSLRSESGFEPLQVLSVVSNKGGVGKTTIATNLAIFIRALREDLPILLIGLDDQTLVDRMFALDSNPPKQTVVDALLSEELDPAIRLGQYGIHYVPSPGDLTPLRTGIRDPDHLRRVIEKSEWRGLVIIDTKSDTDILVRNALAASDLTIAVVKDHQSLLEADKTYDLLSKWGRPRECARVLLSLVDLRVTFAPGESRDVLALLLSAIRERGYPLFETFISHSPKIESLYTNRDWSAASILHGAPDSLVAKQMRSLADDVLARLHRCGFRAPLESHEASRDAPVAMLEQAGNADVEQVEASAPGTDARRRLKLLVAANPARLLGEAGLKTLAVDCPFPAGDNVDIVLQDSHGRIAGVEIGDEIDELDLTAIAQAIQHRAMVGIRWERGHSGTRSILVSDCIPPRVRAVASEYEVECFTVASA
ncbi:MAG: ParA family protein [Deltaproteobacteria bacterium]|nr:ParA family protein [Deltaproteobacteria bacterium]MBW2420797.1 ParA family protein [Deltaproteobacteria bacterium]